LRFFFQEWEAKEDVADDKKRGGRRAGHTCDSPHARSRGAGVKKESEEKRERGTSRVKTTAQHRHTRGKTAVRVTHSDQPPRGASAREEKAEEDVEEEEEEEVDEKEAEGEEQSGDGKSSSGESDDEQGKSRERFVSRDAFGIFVYDAEEAEEAHAGKRVRFANLLLPVVTEVEKVANQTDGRWTRGYYSKIMSYCKLQNAQSKRAK